MHRTDVQTLKRLRPIAEVVESYGIPLRRIGRSLVGRCPFHNDRGRPNLNVFPSTESFYCFRCGMGGDVITFIRQMEGLSFPEAVARLEGRPAILARRKPAPPRLHRHRLSTDERACLLAAAEFYHNRLLREGQALDYLTRRGLSRETIDRHCLGFASGNGLAEYLRWRRLPVGAARRAGLIRPSGVEVFAGRIVYPELREGQVVWMTGRSRGGEVEPRYLGLPGRKPLLGWEAALGERWIVLTEGVFDFLVLRQWGYPAVGVAGTAIGPKLLRAMRRFETVYLALDGDTAGQEATAKAERFLGPQARRLHLGGVKDVAELALLPDERHRFEAALEAWTARAA
jgi:DNA primase